MFNDNFREFDNFNDFSIDNTNQINGNNIDNTLNDNLNLSHEDFIKAYKRELRNYKKMIPDYSLYDFMNIWVDVEDLNIKTHYSIKGIEEEKYSQLNDTICIIIDDSKIKQNIYFNSGEKRGEREVTAKTGTVFVLSPESLGLPFKYKVDKEHEGLDYIDYQDTETDGRLFIYQIPRKYLYRIKKTSLQITKRKRKNYYKLWTLQLTNGHLLYLSVVDYNKNHKNDNNVRTLAVRDGLFEIEDVEPLLSVWQDLGYIVGGDLYDEFNTYDEGYFEDSQFEENTVSLEHENKKVSVLDSVKTL